MQTTNSSDKHQLANIAVNLGLVYNIILALLKTFFGIVGHSRALLADGINSTADVVYYIIVKVLLFLSKKPADKEHPYGHQQLESVASLVVGAFVLTTAIAIFWNSINSAFDFIINGQKEIPLGWLVLVIALATVFSKIAMYFYTQNIYRKTKNPAVRALAMDHRNDILAAGAAAIGLQLSRLRFYYLDPAAGAVVAIFIFLTGIDIIRESSFELMDTLPDENFRKSIVQTSKLVPEIIRVSRIGVHRFGSKFILNLTVEIDGKLSVHDGDTLADKFEDALKERFTGSLLRTNIHYHPEQK
ncbi:MAG: cation diffusion facilitator family transporter [Candidatus Cloacimonetes bacterium]|nr:cation diffusion facilitator family transporter [Candidatus Cloacimonadota bacterium]